MSKKIFSKRMWLILIATLLIFGGVLGMQWFGNKKMNEFMDNMPRPVATVSATQVSTSSWQTAVNSVGTLTAIRGAELATEVSGVVEKIHFENGALVEAGDIILTLQSAPERAELKALQAAQELAAIEMRRANQLLEQRSISKSELDQRASQLDQARAMTAAQQARLEQKTLRAPYDGRLGIRRFNVGDYLQAGDTIIELQALDRLYVDFSLPEQYSLEIKPGMTVSTRVQAINDESFEGVITAVAPIIDRGTRNFFVQATLDNREDMLRPGMFARISVPLGEEQERIVVPQTAIAYRPYGNAVYVIEGELGELKVSQRFVTLGAKRGDMIAIVKGLKVGERVATSGLLKLDSGMPVKIDNSIQPDASLTPQPDNG